MKNNKKLLIMISILITVILIYTAVLIVNKKSNDGQNESETDENESIVAANVSSPVKIEITHASPNKSIILSKREDSSWYWSDKENLALDKSYFTSVETTVSSLSATHKITNVNQNQLNEFGLDSPSLTVKLTDKDNKSTLLSFGIKNAYNASYYMYINEDRSNIYLVSEDTYNIFGFEDVLELADLKILPEINENQLISVTLSDKNKNIVCTMHTSNNSKPGVERFKYKWYLSSNGEEEFPISTSVAENLTLLLTSMEFLDCMTIDPSEHSEYGIDDSDLTLTVKYTNTASIGDDDKYSYVNLKLGKTDELGYYYAVTASDPDTVYLLGGGAYNKLFNYSYEEIAYDMVAYINIDKVKQISVSNDDASMIFTADRKGGSITYAIDGKEIEYSEIKGFIDALSAAKASASTKLPEDENDTDSIPVENTEISDIVVLTVDIVFESLEGLEDSFTLKITRFNDKYNRVSFMGRDTQLITLADSEKISSAFLAVFNRDKD